MRCAGRRENPRLAAGGEERRAPLQDAGDVEDREREQALRLLPGLERRVCGSMGRGE